MFVSRTRLLTTTLARRPLALRPATVNTVRSMATEKKPSLTDLIKEDHEEMYEYYDKYIEAHKDGDVDAQTRWSRQMIWEIARHAVGEEIVVYPLMEKHLGAEGKRLADEDREQHTEVKTLLSELEGMDPAKPEYYQQMKKVIEHLRPHNDSEEQKDLPQLEPKLGLDASHEAGQTFKRTKQFVPTRAHPSLPNKPPFETLAGFLVAPIDKLKDAFAKFPQEES